MVDDRSETTRNVIAGISSRGDGTIIRNNYIEDVAGAGVRVGGNKVGDTQFGINNQVSFGNRPVLSVCGVICRIRCQQETTIATWLVYGGTDIFPPACAAAIVIINSLSTYVRTYIGQIE